MTKHIIHIFWNIIELWWIWNNSHWIRYIRMYQQPSLNSYRYKMKRHGISKWIDVIFIRSAHDFHNAYIHLRQKSHGNKLFKFFKYECIWFEYIKTELSPPPLKLMCKKREHLKGERAIFWLRENQRSNYW